MKIQKIYELGIKYDSTFSNYEEFKGGAVKLNMADKDNWDLIKFKFKDIDGKFKIYENIVNEDLKVVYDKFVYGINDLDNSDMFDFIRDKFNSDNYTVINDLVFKLIEYKKSLDYEIKL